MGIRLKLRVYDKKYAYFMSINPEFQKISLISKFPQLDFSSLLRASYF